MNPELETLLEKHDAEFNYDGENWCLSGVDQGNLWETDDQPAETVEQAEQDAIDYLVEFHSQH